MRIALISLDPDWENPRQNMEKCKRVLESIHHKEVEICIFPETTLTGFCFSSAAKMGVDGQLDSTTEFFSTLARKYNCMMIFGTFVLDSSGKVVRNSAIALDRFGKIIGTYDKLHLFSPGGEHEYITSGDSICIVEEQGVRLGLTICYDLRFPELYKVLSRNCSLVINIANWPSARNAHWISLLKARAIENQIFAIGVNRSGRDAQGVFFEGDSILFDPVGERIRPNFVQGELQIVDLEMDRVEFARRQFDMKSDHRFKLIVE